MSFPIYNACDFFTNEKSKNHLIIHRLNELLKNDIHLPKKPHRHSFYQVLYIKKGEGKHTIDFQEKTFESPIIYFLSPGQVHNLIFESSEVEGLMINFDEHLFNSFLSKINFIDEFSFFKKNGEISCLLITEKNKEIENIFAKIEMVHQQKKINSTQYLRLYLLELFYLTQEFYNNNSIAKNYSNQKNILENFEKLIENHFSEIHYPKFYANELAITPNYLNIICKNYLGKTAGEIIRNRIILEAKRFLTNTQLNIAEISFLLHFEDNSYFTKFFKQNTGITPFQFRNTINL